jgi:hypothetical protein
MFIFVGHSDCLVNHALSHSRFFLSFDSGQGSVSYEIAADEEMTVTIYARCPKGAKFTIADAKHLKSNIVQHAEVKHSGTEDVKEHPTSQLVAPVNIAGPGLFKVKVDSNSTRSSCSDFLVVFIAVHPKKN